MIAPGTHNFRKYTRNRWIHITLPEHPITIGINYRSDDPNVFSDYDKIRQKYGSWLHYWKGDSSSIYFDIIAPKLYEEDIIYELTKISEKHAFVM